MRRLGRLYPDVDGGRRPGGACCLTVDGAWRRRLHDQQAAALAARGLGAKRPCGQRLDLVRLPAGQAPWRWWLAAGGPEAECGGGLQGAEAVVFRKGGCKLWLAILD